MHAGAERSRAFERVEAHELARSEKPNKLCPDVWLLQSSFRFLHIFDIGLNGLLLRFDRGGHSLLVLLNPPRLTPEVRAQISAIEAETNAKVEVILSPGDWHHMQLPSAVAAFPDARLYVASDRNVRKQKALKGRATVLDRFSPRISEVGDDLVLLPWLGYSMDSMPWLLSGEPRGAARIEFVVFHRPSGTLFITDHFFPPEQGKTLKPNTGGFKLHDSTAAKASARSVLEHPVHRAVFSHGQAPACVLQDNARSVLKAAYENLLASHHVPGPLELGLETGSRQ